MFAVIKTGGKQYRVQSGDVLRVEKLAAEAGDKIQFNEILMLGTKIGTPVLKDAGVQAEVLDQIKAKKVIHFVRRRRKHSSKRTVGHRQKLTLVRITDILEKGAGKSGVMAALGAGSVSAVAVVAATPKKAAPKKDTAKKAAPKKAEAKTEAKAETKTAAKKPSAKPAASTDTGTDTGGKPANLLKKARAGGADDLKLISGVGPKLEDVLHTNGVFHFDQIAAWNKAEISYMDDQLSFKGRIDRDAWIKQAKKLMKS